MIKWCPIVNDLNRLQIRRKLPGQRTAPAMTRFFGHGDNDRKPHYRHRGFDVRMRIIILQREILKAEIEQGFQPPD